jgi:hypothetical protein
MKRRIVAAVLVVIVSAFSFARGEAVDTVADHAAHTATTLTTNFQTTTVGSTAWASTLTAPAGTTVSWLLSYKNETQVAVNKLIAYASIPANQTLVAGSVTWFDGSYPNGYVLSDTGLFNEGVQVGAIAPGVNGFIRYRTQSDATTPCGISSRANAYFEIDGVNVPYSATFSTPACATTTSPTTTTTPSSTTPATTPDHTTHTPTPSPTTSDPVVTTTNPVVVTQPTPPSTEPPISSTTVPVDHTSHTVTDADANTTTQSSEPVEPDVTEHTSADHTTSASSTPSTVSSSSAVSEQVAHEAHVLASETTTTDSTTHESHATTTTATTEHQSSEHATHTIPATGGNPFWIMTGALAVGYIGSLLFLNRRHASVRQL